MKNIKSIISVITAVCLLICAIPFSASAIEISDGYIAKFTAKLSTNSSKKVTIEVSWDGLEDGVIETTESINVNGTVNVSLMDYYRVRFLILNDDIVYSIYGTTNKGEKVSFTQTDDTSISGKKFTTYKSSRACESNETFSTIRINLIHIHHYMGSEVYTEPTCTQPGMSISVCSYCKNQYVKSLWNAEYPYENTQWQPLGHDWTQTELLSTPTCAQEGSAVFVCERCSETKTDTVSATGHNWNSGTVLKEATCEESGLITYICRNDASHTKSVVTEPVGHNWAESTVLRPASCDEDGELLYICQNDPEHTKTESIPAAGHNTVKVDSTEATEDAEGNIEYWYCDSCGKLFSDESASTSITLDETVIPKLPHTYTLSLKTDANGSLESDVSGRYIYATSITVTAVEADNSIFSGWYNADGILVSNDISYTFNISSDTELTAHFTAYSYCELTGDGITDLEDVTSVLDYLLDTSSKPAKWVSFADIDGNGEVNLLDAYMIFVEATAADTDLRS